MIDFFKFRENLAEAKKRGVNEERGYIAVHVKKGTTEVYANTSYEAAKAAAKKWGLRSTSGIDVHLAEAKKRKVKEQDLEKDADDPCWDGYVQVGTKMKDGKEVPNCVPMEEAKKHMKEEFSKLLGEKANTDKDEAVEIISKSISMKPSVVKAALKDGGLDPVAVVTALKGRKTIKAKQLSDFVMGHSFGGSVDKKDLASIKKASDKAFRSMKENVNEAIKESKRISSRDDAHKEIEKTMAKGREVQEIGEYVYMILKKGGRIDIEKMKRSAAKMKRNAPEIIDAMISMGLIETIGGKIRNIHPQYHVYESTQISEKLSPTGDKEAYTKFFNAALKRFGADSIADMDDDKKKEFFTYVDKNWESEDEKNEYFQIDEKTVPVNLPDDTWLKIVKTNNPQEDIVQMIDFRYGYEEVEGEKLKVSKMKNGLVHIEASGGDFAIAEIITPQQAKRLNR